MKHHFKYEKSRRYYLQERANQNAENLISNSITNPWHHPSAYASTITPFSKQISSLTPTLAHPYSPHQVPRTTVTPILRFIFSTSRSYLQLLNLPFQLHYRPRF